MILFQSCELWLKKAHKAKERFREICKVFSEIDFLPQKNSQGRNLQPLYVCKILI